LKSTPTYKAERGVNSFFTPQSTIKKSVKADFSYEVSNHLGNVMAVITDYRIPVFETDANGNPTTTIDHYQPELISSTDYYPGGMPMPNRGKSSSDKYSFGYQGSLKDDEIGGESRYFHTYYREGDTYTNTWLSPDPKTALTPWESPYCYMGGNPVWKNDPMGDWIPVSFNKKAGQKRESIKKMFRDEYGLEVNFTKRKLFGYKMTYDESASQSLYSGGKSTTSGNTFSASARNDWMQQLDPSQKGLGRIRFGWEGQDRAGMFNTAFVYMSKMNDDYSYSNFDYGQVPQRSYNFARTVEHEYFGHTVSRIGADIPNMNTSSALEIGATTPGRAQPRVNNYLKEMGLPIQANYGIPVFNVFTSDMTAIIIYFETSKSWLPIIIDPRK